jgi:hypothetical protein
MSGAAVGVTALAAGAVGAVGSIAAADTQAGAARHAQNIAQSQWQQTQALLKPYNVAGTGALGELQYLMGEGTPGAGGVARSSAAGGFGSLNAPFTADMMKQYSPAYQFQMAQGQQGVLNTDASASGALSGAALKDLTSFNQQYANTAFQNAFTQYQTQQQNVYNRLSGLVNTGEAAAAGTAATGAQLAGTAATAAQNVGTAQAGGIVGASNALSGGMTNAALWAQLGGGGFNGLNTATSGTTRIAPTQADYGQVYVPPASS